MVAVTALYAGILALVLVGLSLYVVRGRWANKISVGDGGNADMLARVRAHANFIEYVPIALIGLYLLEVTRHSVYLLHVLGIALVVARLMHPIGMVRKSPNPFRAGGAAITLTILIVEGVLLILAFFAGSLP